MRPLPLIRSAALIPVVAFLRRVGAPATRLLEASQLSPAVLEEAEALLPFSRVNEFYETAAQTQGIPDFGVHAVGSLAPMELGAFGRALAQGGTLGRTLEIGNRLRGAFNSAVRSDLIRVGGDVVVSHQVRRRRPDHRGQLSLMNLALMLNLVRSVAGADWRPRRIDIAAPPLPNLETLLSLRGTEIRFDRPATTVSVPLPLLVLPLPRPRLPPAPGADWAANAPATEFSGSMRQLVGTLLRLEQPSVERVAALVGLSPRTLQRRLHEDGTTLARLVAEARLDLAQRLLRDRDRRVRDVAIDLGYSDPAHFTRAFRAWTGLTPREYRRVSGGSA